MKPAITTVLVLISVVLSSCGGGTGNTTVNPAPTPTPSGGISTVSAAQLQNCPLSDFTTTGKLADGVTTCMRGVISGVTALHGNDACIVEYDGVNVRYKSQAFNMALTVDAKTKAQFQHKTVNGQHTLSDWRDQYETATNALHYVHLLYSQSMDVALANVMIEVQAGSQRGECYIKL